MVKVLFMGRKQVATDALKYLLSLPCVDVVGVLTDSHLDTSPTTDLANHEGLPLFTFDEALVEIKGGRLTYDLGLSMLYWRKLRDEFLITPRLGNINFHPAPLPKYKGTAGYNLAIMDELDEWAATAHYIDDDIDTGGILDLFRFSIFSRSETAQSLERKTQPFLLELFKKTLHRVLETNSQLEVTPNSAGRYTSRKEMEEMKEVRSGDDVNKKIRAFWFPPYHGANIKIDGQKFTLVDESLLQTLAAPGASSLFTSKKNV
jgi:methionyl-tRNA formyltransferase